MSKLQEINQQIEESKARMCTLNREMYATYNNIKKHKALQAVLKRERDNVLFELVCDYVEEGQEYVIASVGARWNSHTKLKNQDTIRIIRKNAKSVTIKIIDTHNPRAKSFGIVDTRIGLIHRIQPHLFGRYVYNIPSIKKAIERNVILKEILG